MDTPQSIAFKIWFTAILVNSVMGTGYLMGFNEWKPALFCFGFGLLLSGMCTLPIFVLLILVMRSCISYGIAGLWAVFLVLLTGIAATVLVFLGFLWLLPLGSEGDMLLVVAVVSAVLAIAVQGAHIAKINNAPSE
ncbi:MAG TPA: hypothetical protein VD993_20020 [Chitinophagaceae bacterium]|nr:hypothetical protein [Chitinophagaceae bacterium]